MSGSRIARSLAGALLVCGSALADEKPKPVVVTNTTTNPVPTTLQGPVTVQGTATVNVSNTATNPVPTKAQGTTQVSGAVDVLSAPPVTGSVTVSNQPTVNLAPGSTVAVSGTVNVASQPPVRLAPGTSVGIQGTPTVQVSGTPTVQISGTPSVNLASPATVSVANSPTVQVAGANFDSSGNLKVTSASGAGAAPAGRMIILADHTAKTFGPNHADNFPCCFPLPDTSDCRSLTLFVHSEDASNGSQVALSASFFVVATNDVTVGGAFVPGTKLDPPGQVQAFLIPGTSAPVVGPNPIIRLTNSTTVTVTLREVQLFCSR